MWIGRCPQVFFEEVGHAACRIQRHCHRCIAAIEGNLLLQQEEACFVPGGVLLCCCEKMHHALEENRDVDEFTPKNSTQDNRISNDL